MKTTVKQQTTHTYNPLVPMNATLFVPLIFTTIAFLVIIPTEVHAKPRSQQANFGNLGGQQNGICSANQIAAPTENSQYRLRANGCGPEGMQVFEDFGLHKCCNQHDICYGICGTSYNFCEKSFVKCMTQVCARNSDAQCKQKANSFSSMTQMFGASFFHNGQKKACDCYESKQAADERQRNYVKDLYTRYDQTKASEENVSKLLNTYKGREGEAYFEIMKKYGANDVEFHNIKEDL
mmetsp:Transcript_12056/g.16380  ORF Transcript_12056/g.16380 Transcript_12056/m.16380 type:complete len:237 (+) Transcript_12056:106-816(+)